MNLFSTNPNDKTILLIEDLSPEELLTALKEGKTEVVWFSSYSGKIRQSLTFDLKELHCKLSWYSAPTPELVAQLDKTTLAEYDEWKLAQGSKQDAEILLSKSSEEDSE
jgi:hypothetical protein